MLVLNSNSNIECLLLQKEQGKLSFDFCSSLLKECDKLQHFSSDFVSDIIILYLSHTLAEDSSEGMLSCAMYNYVQQTIYLTWSK